MLASAKSQWCLFLLLSYILLMMSVSWQVLTDSRKCVCVCVCVCVLLLLLLQLILYVVCLSFITILIHPLVSCSFHCLVTNTHSYTIKPKAGQTNRKHEREREREREKEREKENSTILLDSHGKVDARIVYYTRVH